MKYLKEARRQVLTGSIKKADVKKFCEEHLIDLLDKEFFLTINGGSQHIDTYCSPYQIISINSRDKFKWIDVKDTLIPFFNILLDTYPIYKTISLDRNNRVEHCMINSLIKNDNHRANTLGQISKVSFILINTPGRYT